MKRYLTVNLRTGAYTPARDGEDWADDWKARYPHVAAEDWADVAAVLLYPEDVAEGVPFTYDLCPSGGLFTLWADRTQHSRGAVWAAKRWLRRTRDVVSLRVRSLRPATVRP
ncbi:MAG: hypothetical protein WC789_09400 [Lentisphaeria bacterium]